MSKLSISFISIIIALNSLGQDSTFQRRSRFRPGAMWFFTGFRPATPDKVTKYDRLVFDFTYNDWFGDLQLFDNSWKSIGVTSNFMFDKPLTKGSTIALGFGPAYEFAVINHNDQFNKSYENNTTSFEVLEQKYFKKRSYISHTILLPVELRFRSEKWKHVKLHIGGRVGYQISALEKTKVIDSNGDKLLTKSYGFPDEAKLIYGAHLRFGIRNWAFFGAVYFNPMFTNAESIQLNRAQAGLSLSLF